MSNENVCLLCGLAGNYQIDIFSEISIEMNIHEIINNHFKLEIDNEDLHPKHVCSNCWAITNSFHELYQLAQSVQERFSQTDIKLEPATYSSEDEEFKSDIIFEDTFKMEPSLDTFEDPLTHVDQMQITTDEITQIESNSKRKAVGRAKSQKNQPKLTETHSETKRERRRIADIKIEFEKLFPEHKHRFDMSCDNCPMIFNTLYEAQGHYTNVHNQPKGYIKCCNVKLHSRSVFLYHLQRHLDPEKLKCSKCGKVFTNRNYLILHTKKCVLRKRKSKKDPNYVYCDICNKSFTKKPLLINHLNWHIENKKTNETHNKPEQASEEPLIISKTRLDMNGKRRNVNIKVEFEKLFFENKHRFDMSCDSCPIVFNSLYEAQGHYETVHDIPRGYIKCCNVKLECRTSVISHLHRYLDPEKFKCTECDKVYVNQQILNMHMKSKHTENPILKAKDPVHCDICKKSFAKKQNLKIHLDWHTKMIKYEEKYSPFIAKHFDMKCDQCEEVFNKFLDATHHYKSVHNVDNGYIKCCGMKLNTLTKIFDHIDSHNNPNEFKCDLCLKTYTDRMYLYRHKLRHRYKQQRKYICDYCGKSMQAKGNVLQHMFTFHMDSKPTHKCHLCEKSFRLESLLKRHIHAHGVTETPAPCEICGKIFKRKVTLEQHMLVHGDKSKRILQCKDCGEWLLSQSGIYYHKQKHSKEVQKCTECDMQLPNRNALGEHTRRYHREHTFKCNYCDKSYQIASLLRKHEESHTRHKLYPCLYCSKTFTVQKSLQTHNKRHHRDKKNVQTQLISFKTKE